jgi:hypothetical protein
LHGSRVWPSGTCGRGIISVFEIVDLVLSHFLIAYLSKLSKLLKPTIWCYVWKDFKSLGTYNLWKYNNILLFSQLFIKKVCSKSNRCVVIMPTKLWFLFLNHRVTPSC